MDPSRQGTAGGEIIAAFGAIKQFVGAFMSHVGAILPLFGMIHRSLGRFTAIRGNPDAAWLLEAQKKQLQNFSFLLITILKHE